MYAFYIAVLLFAIAAFGHLSMKSAQVLVLLGIVLIVIATVAP